MPNELVPAGLVKAQELAEFDAVASNASTYLSRLQLFGSKSDACAEGLIGIGHWGLVSDDVITDLGKEVDIVVIAWRSKALQTGGEDGLLIDYDQQSDLFKQIATASNVKDSGAMYGPEFLVYVPAQGIYATLFMSSKTARREAKKFKPLLQKAATLKCRLIEKGRYKWHGPVVLPCTAPVESLASLDQDVLVKQIETFENPPKEEREVAEPEDSKRER